MDADHFFIDFLIRIIVVPVNQSKFRIRFFPVTAVGIVGNIIITAAGVGSDIHIAPDHRFQSQLFTDFKNAGAVFANQDGTFGISVFPEIFSKAELCSFIHAQMYPVGGKGLFYGAKHFFNKCVDFFFSYLKDVSGVLNGFSKWPFQSIVKMGQCLDTRNKFNAESSCISIHLADLILAVAAAVSTEIRFVRYGVSFFGVKHQCVHSKLRHDANERFYFFYGKYGISGTVQHHPVSGKIYRFTFRGPGILQMMYCPVQSPIIMRRFLAGDMQVIAVSCDGKRSIFLKLYLNLQFLF